MSCSLDNLASNLTDFPILTKIYPKAEDRALLKKKAILPYDYLTSFDKFEERQLPSREQFFNRLKNKHVDESSYRDAQQLWSHFGCQTLGDFLDLYLTVDILLLAEASK